MPTVYLEPEDVPAFEAGRVLAALNTAPDAAWLATAIEFPNEPDIGLRLGQRLIDRRDELGGYTTLAEVADVYLIGPERFTEIVVALSGRAAADYLEVPATGPAGWTAPRGALGLRLLTAGPWLGQLTTVVATATVDGVRRAGIEVLVAAGTGRLRAVSGGRLVAGATVTLVTGADGVARATWVPSAIPPLDPAAAAALADALAQLPVAGATPASSLEALGALVTAYRWEPNGPLRRAVDSLAEGVMVDPDDVDLGAAWPTVETTVTAWGLGGPDTPTGAAESMAVQPLVTRDWRLAFVRAYHDQLVAGARLASHLESERRESRDAVDLVGRVQQRVGAFLDVQQGRLGGTVAKAVAAGTSRAFVVERTADLALDDALQVAPVINATAATAGTATPSVLQALTATRSTVLHRMDTSVALPLQARLDVLDGTVAAKVDQSTLDDAIAQKVDRAELDDVVSGLVGREELDERLAGKLDRAELDQVVSGLVGREELDERLRGRVSLDEFRAFADETDARLRRLEG